MSKSKITIICFSLFVLDRISKIIALESETVLFNRNFGFGLPSYNLSLVISLIFFVLLIYFVFLKRKSIFNDLFLLSLVILIIVGGISNIIDRVFFGGVIDFINIGIFPSFNFADIYISIGVLMAVYKLLLVR